MPSVDPAEILVEGPWRHRFVSANGARFHLAEAGAGPPVVLLHGFPQFWWCWRHQLTSLADAGYRAIALDLRGYGASDKPPRGYDTATLAADVAGVVRAIGESRAAVVGHDWGGWVAWAMPAYAPQLCRAIGVVSAAHPLRMRRGVLAVRGQRAALRPVWRYQIPMLPERRLAGGAEVDRVLRAWGGPGFPDAATATRYRRAMRVPFVAHTSMEYFRWAVRSVPRRDGRRFAAAVRPPASVPVLHLHGADDPYVLPATARVDRRLARGPVRSEIIPGAGHFLPEEAPSEVSQALLSWLGSLPE